MKLLKNSFLGTVFLFALGTASIAGNSNTTDVKVQEIAVKVCSLTYSACDDLYPTDYNGFDQCMQRGGCS
ncbi:hypothetical protein ES731_13445 [Psychroflexus gondwanensis]|jgi:hypothetical protein|uniref:hypothetical protein n=1 Tax=Psychroflexus gondwanensis TaxID=251 RepID=UPI0011BDC7DF|nr:hypothetical protein [Psychroflexus gondwanensis]TXE16815.1 hypothetical protein ES731_13445 [Psychroflexus gondwanensis]